MPLYSTIYLFNWTNPEDLNTESVKPNFEQLGPYTFSEFKVKEDLQWDQPEVTYFGKRTWHFLPEKSNGSLEDVVVAPHFPSLVSLSRNNWLQHTNTIKKGFINYVYISLKIPYTKQLKKNNIRFM